MKTSYSELVQNKLTSYVNYQSLLGTIEWDEKRSEVLKRDDCKCKMCGKWETVKQFMDGVGAYHCWFDDSSIDYFLGIEKKYKPSIIFGEDARIICYNGGMAEILADKPYHLEVHHKYYLRSSLPWQYKDDALVTLCNWCHRGIHANGEPIPVYQNQSVRDFAVRYDANASYGVSYYTPCSRCDGTGELPVYDHVQKGICFRCRGAGFDELNNFKI